MIRRSENGRRAGLRTAAAVLLVVGFTAVPAAAQQAEPDTPQRAIRVSGNGEVRVTPDLALIDFAVETTGSTAQEAGQRNAQAMDRVIQALTAAGVARPDLQTRGYMLIPVYAPQQRPPRPEPMAAPEEPRIVGYRAANTVTVRAADVARVGRLIDAALGAGANRMHGLRFSLQDPEAAQAAAIQSAAQQARRTAEVMAAALGVRLGQLVEASTTADTVRPMMHMERAMMAAADAPTPIEPGEQTVSAMVTVVFAIDG